MLGGGCYKVTLVLDVPPPHRAIPARSNDYRILAATRAAAQMHYEQLHMQPPMWCSGRSCSQLHVQALILHQRLHVWPLM